MPRKAKHKYPKLPAGFGCIKHLSGNRRKPYAVYPSYKGLDINGCPIMPPALCYVDSWLKGFAVLTAYNAGTYTPGMESSINVSGTPEVSSMNDAVKRLLTDYSLISQRTTGKAEQPREKTFAEVYDAFFKWKYENPQKTYSASSRNTTQNAYQKCAALHDRIFRELRYPDLQGILDNCPCRHASLEHILSLIKQMYAYANLVELCDRDYSAHVKIQQKDDDVHGVPFTESDLNILWANRENNVAQVLLIMCYSGHRIGELKVVDVDLENMSMTGGLKTAASKSRVVPIHSAIQPIIRARIAAYGCLLPGTTNSIRPRMRAFLSDAQIDATHTPHDCRHTFSMLCEKYRVAENDRKRLLGHAFSSADVTNRVYGHRALEELRAEIEKIPAPPFCY